jgi:cytochrome c551/c552
MRRWLLGAGLVAIAGFLAIQLVPYGRDHTNPPGTGAPPWDSERTLALARTACFDCHSNETVWPWYSNIAPLSWRLTNHVVEGRAALNFSEWASSEQETDEIVEVVEEGDMPPWDYVLAHPDAQLSGEDRAALIQGLDATFGAGEGGEDEEGDEGPEGDE